MDNIASGEWVESMGGLVGVISRRQVWLVGGNYGCGYQEVGMIRMYRMYRCG